MNTNNNYNSLLNQIKRLEQELDNCYKALNDTSDGFYYIVKIEQYHFVSFNKYQNEYLAQKDYNSFYGDNGYATIYTNNPDIKNNNYEGTIIVVDTETIELLYFYPHKHNELNKYIDKVLRDYKRIITTKSFDYNDTSGEI